MSWETRRRSPDEVSRWGDNGRVYVNKGLPGYQVVFRTHYKGIPISGWRYLVLPPGDLPFTRKTRKSAQKAAETHHKEKTKSQNTTSRTRRKRSKKKASG